MPSDAVQFITACPNDRFWLSKDKGVDKLRTLQVHNGSMVATDFLILHLSYSRYIIIVLYGCKVTASLCQIVTLLEK